LTIGPVAADFILGNDRFALNWVVAASLVVLGTGAGVPPGETRPASAPGGPGGWLPPRTALLPGLLVLLALLGFGGFVAFSALYARDDLGFDRPGLIFALWGSVVVLVRAFARKLPDRLGGRRTLILCFVNLAIGLATIGAWQSGAGLIVGTAIFAVRQAPSFPAAVLLAMESSSDAGRGGVGG